MTQLFNNRIQYLLFSLLVVVILFLNVSLVAAQDSDITQNTDISNSLCAGANLDVNSNCASDITNEDANTRINDLIADVINLFSLVVGVVSVIMIIIGGFRYIVSGGDTANVTSAKNTILYAIIGLVIVALAQTIVRFVLRQVLEV